MTKILIADDESDIREVVKVYGELNGYEVDEAGDGIETLEKIKDNTYDLVILDVMMPGMDGFEMIRRLRNNRDLDRMDIIIVSAISGNKDQLAQLPSDITIFGKPIPFHEIKGFILGRIAARQRVA